MGEATLESYGSSQISPLDSPAESELHPQTEPEPADPERQHLVEAARQVWIRRLIDYSRSNSLLFFRDLKVGTLDLTRSPSALSDLLSGKQIRSQDLLPPLEIPTDDPEKAARLREQQQQAARNLDHRLVSIQRKAKLNDEEKGLQTLHLGLGLASWPATDNGRPYLAPLLLIPVKIGGRGKDDRTLKIHGDPAINPVLDHALQDQYRVSLGTESILKSCTGEDDEGKWSIDPECAWRLAEQAAAGVRGFHVEQRAVLANFHFAKMAMVKDLQRHREALIANPLVAALAGHQPSRKELSSAATEISSTELDQLPAYDENLVLDADGSQMAAIRKVCRGQNLVIEGPPGTGKSQTIANLIAQSIAEGRRVLFVAEKRAALDAVIKRLRAVDLAHLVLDLHGASVSRKDIMGSLAEALDRMRHAQPAEQIDAVNREYEAGRQRLNAHVERLHRARQPDGLSLYAMMGRLLTLPAEAKTSVCIPDHLLEAWTPERVSELHRLLEQAAALAGIFVGDDPSPWARASISSRDAARQLTSASQALDERHWPELQRRLERLLRQVPLREPETLAAVEEALGRLADLLELRAIYGAELFQASELARHSQALAPAASGLFRQTIELLRSPEYRRSRREVRALRTSAAPASQLLAEVRRAERALQWWGARRGTEQELPIVEDLPEVQQAFSTVRLALEPILEALGKPFDSLGYTATGELLRALASDRQTPYRVPRAASLRRQLIEQGLGALLEDLCSRPLPPDQWSQRFDYARLNSAVERAMTREPELTEFRGEAHERLVETFCRLDRERIHLAAQRVRRLHAERVIEAMNSHRDQADLIRREARKKSRHLPLRELFAAAPEMLTRLAPCWVASPLSVSQLLDGSHRYFDLVIFDEASQVVQEEAVPSLLRAQQIVVAGDRHQLPPTTFFATAIEGADDEDDPQEPSALSTAREATSGYESLLDTLWTFLPNTLLRWHYRSVDERLIAFSNHHIYDDKLITFPNATTDDVLDHVLESSDPGLANEEESCSREVHEVVQQVIRHALERPEESLGVITMGIKHANRVQAALDQELRLHPDLADYFALEREERFFVKNLETVQGDERDAIILSVGYGKLPDGSLPHRFGPLTQEQGHRRLNVAITRARRRMTLASSFSHREVDLNRSGSRGVELLKGYLEYAASGGRRLPLLDTQGTVPPNHFESDVQAALANRGLRLVPQYGASHYRIDLVAMHPEETRPVLAIECDGATYHSTAPARERDRLRQEHLQRLGWRFHRIWSTDWFFRREEEIDRAVSAYEDAVRACEIGGKRGRSEPPQAQSTTRSAASSIPLSPPPSARGPAPRLPRHGNISDYSDAHLLELAGWVASDRLLRPDDEMVREIFEQLPFRRLGPRIRQRLQATVRQWNAGRGASRPSAPAPPSSSGA
ncbi:MAG TPA: AAA domain-containing protein [Thermoanaerobaculia bacterium]|nr:AAA domain-containing protein [Thermoanaerobaculia bacterium]